MLTRSLPEPATHVLILVARVTVAVIMLAHVWQSFFLQGFGTATDQFANLGIPLAIVATAFTLVVELVGSVLIALGILVPWAAGAMAFVMYGAIYFVHGSHGVFVKNGGWELVALIAGICLAIAAFGPGRYSLDHLIFDRKKPAPAPEPVDVGSDPAGVPIAPAPLARPAAPAPRWEDDRRWHAEQAARAEAAAPRWDDQPRWDTRLAPSPRRDVEQPYPPAMAPSIPVVTPADPARPVSLWDDGSAVPAFSPGGVRVPSAYANSSARPAPRGDEAPAWTEPPARQDGPALPGADQRR